MTDRLTVEEHNRLVNAVQMWCRPSHSDILTQLIQSEREAYQQLTEKDAAIERLEIALYTHQSYDKTVSELHEENVRLRKALEETRISIGNAYEYGFLRETDCGDVQRMLDRISAALGEGDKE